MDNSQFGLNEDQRAVQEMARNFADAELAPNAVAWDRDEYFPVEVIRRAAELGMGAIFVPEELGGSGLGRLEAALIFEALATGCPTIAGYIAVHNMVVGMVAAYGNDAQRQRWLPALATMDCFASYCLTEPGSGSDAAALRTTAVRDGDGWRLNGVKQFISGAGTSGLYVVMARTGAAGPKGVSAFAIERGAPGLSFGPLEHKMGWKAQPTRQVILEDVRVPADAALGNEGDGFKIAMAGLDGGRLNIGACSLGGAQSAFEKSVAYLADRQAFGQPLNQFQALQFKLADMETQLAAARLLLYQAASAMDVQAPDATRRCAMAKLFATDAGFHIANQALQLHGGYGYLADYGLEKIVRDLRVHQILEGTNEIMHVIIARGLKGGNH
jgi:alkylation response protein AidB-like acyl-CoA dehydrogenase